MNCANCGKAMTLTAGDVFTIHRGDCLGDEKCHPVVVCSVLCEQAMATAEACTTESGETFGARSGHA